LFASLDPRDQYSGIVSTQSATRNLARGVKRILVNSPLNLLGEIFSELSRASNRNVSKPVSRRVVSASNAPRGVKIYRVKAHL